MLYFWINGLETTEEECFTQQQKVFVSVFSISFSLAWYLVFNSAKSLRVRFRSYTNYRHSVRRKSLMLFIPTELSGLTVLFPLLKYYLYVANDWLLAYIKAGNNCSLQFKNQ